VLCSREKVNARPSSTDALMLMVISGYAVPNSKNIVLNKMSYHGIGSVLGESLYPDEETIAEFKLT